MARKNFEEVWTFIMGLEGKEVRTLERRFKNEIRKVTRDAVYVFSERSISGDVSKVSRSQFEDIWYELVKTGQCSEVRARYVAYAIIAKLPEVTYGGRPVTLYLAD